MKVGLIFEGYKKAPPDQLKLPTAPRTGPSGVNTALKPSWDISNSKVLLLGVSVPSMAKIFSFS